MKKKFLIIGSFVIIGLACIVGVYFGLRRELTINEILETKSYSYLSPRVKQYIKDHYEETGEIFLTKDNAKYGQPYLNPAFIYYLDNQDNETNPGIIPNEITAKTRIVGSGNSGELPSKYDMRNVNGNNYVSPLKDQGTDGLCWAFATNAVLESYYLKQGVTRYFSEYQLDYATATNGVDLAKNTFIDNQHYLTDRTLGNGGNMSHVFSVLMNGIGAVSSTWENTNRTKISKKEKLPAYEVYNYDNSIVEVDEANVFDYDPENLSASDKAEAIAAIKQGIMDYSGAWASIWYGDDGRTINRYSDDIVIHSPDAVINHALQIIGWDDNFEYGFCKYTEVGSDGGVIEQINNDYYNIVNGEKVYYCNTDFSNYNTNSTYSSENVEGRGAWIFKNSWGDVDSYVYVTYDTFIGQVSFFTKYDTREWDNGYDLYYDKDLGIAATHDDYISGYSYSLKDAFIPQNEKLYKIKLNSYYSFDFELYISNDNGNTFTKIDDYTRLFPGYMMIDFSESNYVINNNTVLSILSRYNMPYTLLHVYTKNNDEEELISTLDYTYGAEVEEYSNDDYVDIKLTNYFKNVTNHQQLDYKIKKSNNYLSNSSYSVVKNYTYMNRIDPTIRINADAFLKGDYVLEMYEGVDKIAEGTLQIQFDFLKTLGNGSSNNPWQITNTRQLNMMRHNPYDYYILKNDIDFEYDTQDEEGIFYNDGKGFTAIEEFYGDLNGNGKTIKNMYTTTGFIQNYVYDETMLTTNIGVHDLKMKNMRIDVDLSNNKHYFGGIVNNVYVDNKSLPNFNNLQVIDNIIEAIDESPGDERSSIVAGGIFGRLYIYNEYHAFRDDINVVVASNNWYGNTKFNGDGVDSTFAGLIGAVDGSYASGADVTLNNMIFEGTISVKNASSSITDLMHNCFPYINYYLNNIISNGTYSIDPYGIGIPEYYGDGVVVVNHAIVNLPTRVNDRTTYNDVVTNVKSFEIANADFDDWGYYLLNGYAYDTMPNSPLAVEYSFNEYWNHLERDGIKRVPILKGAERNYTSAQDVINLNVGETLHLEDVVNFTNNIETAHIVRQMVCSLDVCETVADNQVISLEDDTIIGLKKGTTSAIYYNDTDGYIKNVTVNVLGDGEYAITFIPNGGIVNDNSLIVKSGDSIVYPVPTREHYNFLGWYQNLEDENPYMEEVFEGSSNITLYAKWEINGYVVNFDSNGGSEVESVIVDMNTAIGQLPIPTQKGYDFVGWYVNDVEITSETIITSDLDVTAHWAKTDYYIRYDVNGGLAVNSTKVHYGEAVGSVPVPIKDGYVFRGWYLEKDNVYSPEITSEYIYNYYQDMVAYAVYDMVSYSIALDANGGYLSCHGSPRCTTSVYTNNSNKLTSWQLPDNDYGKIFLGWFSEREGGEEYYLGHSISGDITLYAHWADEAYYVYLVGADDVTSKYLEPNSKYGYLPIPKKDGYRFVGWFDDIGENANEITSNSIFDKYEDTWIFAHWLSVDQYTVSFDSNGGDEVLDTITIQNGYEYGTLPIPTKNGYGFLGWFTKIDGGNRIKFDDVFNIAQDQVLYAHWLSPEIYRISFDSNGGLPISTTIEKYPGEAYGELPIPTRDDYTFIGWYNSLEDGHRIDSDTVFDGTMNTTLYAHWREGMLSECIVTFDTNGGSGIIEPVHLFTGDVLTLPVVTKKGYTLINWTYNGDPVDENTSFDNVSDALIVANWQANTYTIRFDANGGIGSMDDLAMVYDRSKQLPPSVFEKKDHVFEGWSKTRDGEICYEEVDIVNNVTDHGIVTLYAVWHDYSEFTVATFDPNGGEYVDSYFEMYNHVYLYDNDPIGYLPEVMREGYTFVNWRYNNQVVDEDTTFNMTPEVVLKAQWQANKYTVLFDANGGTGIMDDLELTYDIESRLPDNQFVNGNKIFIGWSKASDGNIMYQNEELTKNIVSEGEITLYAQWADTEENVCTVSFDANGGKGDINKIYLYGDQRILLFPELIKTGYTFINWTNNGSPVDSNTDFGNCNEVTLVANWRANKYTVKFHHGFEEEVGVEVQGTMEDIEMTYDVEQSLPLNAYTIEGKTFRSWWTDFGYSYLDGDVVKNLATEGEVILTADWVNNESITTLIFDGNGAEGDIPNLIIFDNQIYNRDKLPKVTRDGYTFVNWMYNGKVVTIYTDFSDVQEATLVADWQANDYTIRFNANGGTGTMDDLAMVYDITKSLTDNAFEKEGYRFIGWSKTSNGTVLYQNKEAVKNLALEGEITLYAVWELIPEVHNDIIFDPNGGLGDMMYIPAAATINLPECTFIYPGYRFVGWSTEKNGQVVYSNGQENITNLTEETILYAKWEKSNASSNLLIDDIYMQKTSENLEVSSYIDSLNIEQGKELMIYNRQGVNVTDAIIGTGWITKILQDGQIISTKVNIIKGDVTGDGISNIADVKKIADYTLTGKGLEYFDINAAEVTKNNQINIADVKRIADYTLDKEIDLWN